MLLNAYLWYIICQNSFSKENYKSLTHSTPSVPPSPSLIDPFSRPPSHQIFNRPTTPPLQTLIGKRRQGEFEKIFFSKHYTNILCLQNDNFPFLPFMGCKRNETRQRQPQMLCEKYWFCLKSTRSEKRMIFVTTWCLNWSYLSLARPEPSYHVKCTTSNLQKGKRDMGKLRGWIPEGYYRGRKVIKRENTEGREILGVRSEGYWGGRGLRL